MATRACSPTEQQRYPVGLPKKSMKKLHLSDAPVPAAASLSSPVLRVRGWLFRWHHTVPAEDSQHTDTSHGSTFMLTITEARVTEADTLLICMWKTKPNRALCLDASVFPSATRRRTSFLLSDVSAVKKFQAEKHAGTATNQSLNPARFQIHSGSTRKLFGYNLSLSLSGADFYLHFTNRQTDMRTATG